MDEADVSILIKVKQSKSNITQLKIIRDSPYCIKYLNSSV